MKRARAEPEQDGELSAVVETGILSAISKEDDKFRDRGAKRALTARRGLRLVRGG